MNARRFSDDDLLALIEGGLPEHRAAELRDAIRDGDLELAGRLIDMAEHRDFLREMSIDKSELNPGSAHTPAGVVAAAIAVAERESLVPNAVLDASERRNWWKVGLAAGVGLAAVIGLGVFISGELADSEPVNRLPRNADQLVESGQAQVRMGIDGEEQFEGMGPFPEGQAPPSSSRFDQEEIRRMVQEMLAQDAGPQDFEWPQLVESDGGRPSGVADPIERQPIEFASGTGLSELLSEQELSDIVTALGHVGVRSGAQARGELRFTGVDAIGEEREFTLEEAASLAKVGRLALVLENTGSGPGELLAASGARGGYLAGKANRFSFFTVEAGEGAPDGVDQLRNSDLVRELSDRTADATGQRPGVVASYSFDAAGVARRVSDAERVTMLELIAAVTSPLSVGPEGSRLRLIELPFDGSDDPTTSGDPDNPFWWLTPEADWSESATTLVPVVVR